MTKFRIQFQFYVVCPSDQSSGQSFLIHGKISGPLFADDYILYRNIHSLQKESEYDQEIPQPHTSDQLMALRGRATQQ